MTLVEEVPRTQYEEVLPLVQSLELDRPAKQHKIPWHNRMKLQLQKITPELVAIALVYFVQGILRLSSLATSFFEKDHLHMEPTQMAIADTIANLPWAVKPIYGFITDSFPIRGLKRRPYLIIAGLTGSFSWLCLAAFARTIPSTVACITAAAAATAFSDVVADSIVVELARASPGATEGALQSLCWGAHAFGRVITAYLSGWLVDRVGPKMVFFITATFPLIVCVSSCLINEKKLSAKSEEPQPSAAQGTDELPDSHGDSMASHEKPVESVELLASTHVSDRFPLNHRSSSSKDQQQQHADGATAAADLRRTSSTDSDQHSHAGPSKNAGRWHQLFGGMAASVGLFWRAVKQPHVLRPVVFLFLWQATPGAGTAMFYFKTNKLGFDAEFFGRVKLVVALADLLGILVYNSFLKRVRLRQLMLWGSVLGCALGLTPLLLVEGINRKVGISDKAFALVDSALLSSISQILLMPTLVLAARLCPEGVEATLYASLMSLNNAAGGVADMLGALLMKLFGITSSNFVHLSALLLSCNVLSVLPLPLIGWVPDESTKGITQLGEYKHVDANDTDTDAGTQTAHYDSIMLVTVSNEGQPK